MQPDSFVRSLLKARLFTRRRGRLVFTVFAIAFAVGWFAVEYAPQRFRAVTVLRPQGEVPYPGPLEQFLEDLRDEQVVEAMAAQSGLDLHRDLWDRVRGRATLTERFEVAVSAQPIPSKAGDGPSVEIKTSVLTPTEEGSELAAAFLASTLMRFDTSWRTTLRVDEPERAASDEPDYRAQLHALRSSAPEADGAELVRRLRDLRKRIAEAEIKQASLLAKEQAAAEALQELDARVAEEATQAYLAHLDAERDKARKAAIERELSGKEPPRDSRLARIAQLEAQLERMLATRTRRHPEVRELVRVLEAERRAAADAGLTPTAPTADAPDPLDADFDSTAFQPGPTPPVWRQRAPSYPGWVGARDEVLAVRQQLAVAKEELHALVTQREGLEAAQSRAEETQRELARLERLADEQDQRAEEHRAEQAQAPPLERVTLESVKESQLGVGLPGVLFLSLLLAFGIGAAVDVSDDSYRLPEEVVELGVPVLGVIPHLKGA